MNFQSSNPDANFPLWIQLSLKTLITVGSLCCFMLICHNIKRYEQITETTLTNSLYAVMTIALVVNLFFIWLDPYLTLTD